MTVRREHPGVTPEPFRSGAPVTTGWHTSRMPTVTFRDESATGKALHSFDVRDVPDTITVRDLIRLRVREEVARFNAAPTGRFQGLVRPTDAEADLNGYRLSRPRRLDWERQADVACRAFARNGFFVLVGDRQVGDLDEVVDLSAASGVAFVKLVQLVGG
jgi:hypothetical protein